MRAITLSHERLQRARTYTAIHQSPKTPTIYTTKLPERRAQYNTTTLSNGDLS